jgi:hypothetical protein
MPNAPKRYSRGRPVSSNGTGNWEVRVKSAQVSRVNVQFYPTEPAYVIEIKSQQKLLKKNPIGRFCAHRPPVDRVMRRGFSVIRESIVYTEGLFYQWIT